jgi:hypothetical protein
MPVKLKGLAEMNAAIHNFEPERFVRALRADVID